MPFVFEGYQTKYLEVFTRKYERKYINAKNPNSYSRINSAQLFDANIFNNILYMQIILDYFFEANICFMYNSDQKQDHKNKIDS